MRVADVVARCLHDEGVETFFGVVGSGNFTVTVSLHALGARFVAARHENGAICMADAHARVSGQLGCVSVHQGPGFTNAITGLTEAAKARTPLILVAADTPAGETRSNFFVEQARIAEAGGAGPGGGQPGRRAHAHTVEGVPTPARGRAVGVDPPPRLLRRGGRGAPGARRRAIGPALGRRAVVLTLPLDVIGEEAEWPQEPFAAGVPAAPAPSPPALDDVVAAIERAERPVIVAGRGAVLSDAREPLERLGARIGAPLATSAMGHGIFNGHPFALGISGGFAPPPPPGGIRASAPV